MRKGDRLLRITHDALRLQEVSSVEVPSNKDMRHEKIPGFEGTIAFDEPMSAHTSFKIGGPADIFAVPRDVSDLQILLARLHRDAIPVFVLGAGTNLLVADKGIRGAVVQLGLGFRRVHIRREEVSAGAALKLARLMRESIARGLGGLECVAGIPGTVGGAICMNAGTPQGCIRDSLTSVTALDLRGALHNVPTDELGLEYRKSNVRERGLIIAGAVFHLTMKDPSEINHVVKYQLHRRRLAQPPGIGTAGSVFKNPPDTYAGQMLEDAGAKGMQVGGARVSSRHANWIENTGSASASDVRELMNEMKDLVAEKSGVILEPEIELVGEW